MCAPGSAIERFGTCSSKANKWVSFRERFATDSETGGFLGGIYATDSAMWVGFRDAPESGTKRILRFLSPQARFGGVSGMALLHGRPHQPRRSKCHDPRGNSKRTNHSDPRRIRNQDDEPLIDIAALAAALDVKVCFVRRLVWERRIPYYKVGKFIRFKLSEVRRWLDGRRIDPLR
ncbi:helix-turn-helix domain-containing protein [Ilumatobacter nonamiensis]|uniref:helix-turn-helix domain-containing protein n=1 Tax=Ilumatobacter nonamiensis TaxID=467093 RepID=UPI000A02A270|nr:helix-turn-helix domain-containing protein [Ilumatobacter nonamiensis]